MNIHELMKPMMEEARRDGKWLWCRYQDLWFSPDQLEDEWAKGSFRWGPVNWQLRDPKERLKEADERVERAKTERDRIAASISR